MWVIVKMITHHTGVQLPVILVDNHSEIMTFQIEDEARKMRELFAANSDSGHEYIVKKYDTLKRN
jgi:hypothetical protein